MNTAIEVAAKRGRTGTALSAIESQKKARAALVEERKRESATLVTLQTERAQVAAKGRQAETEAAPIRYVAEMLGADTDSERTIRWLIALMVLCCDPLAIALTAATSARRSCGGLSYTLETMYVHVRSSNSPRPRAAKKRRRSEVSAS